MRDTLFYGSAVLVAFVLALLSSMLSTQPVSAQLRPVHFEYRILYGNRNADLVQIMNQAGTQGWRAISISTGETGNNILLERQVP